MPAGSAPALRTMTRSSASSTVKRPRMMPLSRYPVLDPGRRDDFFIQDDGDLFADIFARDLFEPARPSGLSEKDTAGLFHSSCDRLTERRSLPVTAATLSRDKTRPRTASGSPLTTSVSAGTATPSPPSRAASVSAGPALTSFHSRTAVDLDEVLDPVGVFDAGELDDEAVGRPAAGSAARRLRTRRSGCGASRASGRRPGP